MRHKLPPPSNAPRNRHFRGRASGMNRVGIIHRVLLSPKGIRSSRIQDVSAAQITTTSVHGISPLQTGHTVEKGGEMAEDQGNTHLVRGILAGVAGGLVASWVMNVFIEGAGPKISEAVESVSGQAHDEAPREQEQSEDQAPKEDATMKTADAVVSTVTGGRHLSFEERQKGGPIVHYAFGGLMGGLYGAMAEYLPATRAGFGTVFASALFTGADVIAVPALNLSGSSADAPVSALATPFAAHLVYGITTEGVRRLVRAML